jgi:hypothetical protein
MDAPRQPLDAGTDAAASKLVTALRRPGGHVVVTAPRAGAADALVARVDERLAAFERIRLDGERLDETELARAFAARDESPATLHAAVRARIAEARRDARPLLVILRNAHGTSTPALEKLRLLLECTPDAPDLVRLLLVGGPALQKTLARAEARALASRVTTRVTVPSPPATPVPHPIAPETRPARRYGRVAAAGIVGAAASIALMLVIAYPGARRAGPPPRLSVPSTRAPGLAAAPAPRPVAVPTETAKREDAPTASVAAPVPRAAAPAPRPAAPVIRATAPAARAAVRVAATGPEPTAVSKRAPVPAPSTALQVGAFRDPANAAALRRELGRHFAHVTVSAVARDGQTLHRVRVEGLTTPGALQTAMTSLRKAGHHPFQVTSSGR